MIHAVPLREAYEGPFKVTQLEGDDNDELNIATGDLYKRDSSFFTVVASQLTMTVSGTRYVYLKVPYTWNSTDVTDEYWVPTTGSLLYSLETAVKTSMVDYNVGANTLDIYYLIANVDIVLDTGIFSTTITQKLKQDIITFPIRTVNNVDLNLTDDKLKFFADNILVMGRSGGKTIEVSITECP